MGGIRSRQFLHSDVLTGVLYWVVTLAYLLDLRRVWEGYWTFVFLFYFRENTACVSATKTHALLGTRPSVLVGLGGRSHIMNAFERRLPISWSLCGILGTRAVDFLVDGYTQPQ